MKYILLILSMISASCGTEVNAEPEEVMLKEIKESLAKDKVNRQRLMN